MKIKIRMLIIILTFIISIFSLPLYSKAFSFDSIFGDAEGFLEIESPGSAVDTGKLESLSNSVSGILLTIALAVTFISIVVMGINFAIQTVEEKAKIKESMVPWIIGIFISFGAYGIWEFTMLLFDGMI